MAVITTLVKSAKLDEKVDYDHICETFPSVLQHQKSSQWCQEHFLNYKGLLRAMTVREQLRRLMNKFKVQRNTSEGVCVLIEYVVSQKYEQHMAQVRH